MKLHEQISRIRNIMEKKDTSKSKISGIKNILDPFKGNGICDFDVIIDDDGEIEVFVVVDVDWLNDEGGTKPKFVMDRIKRSVYIEIKKWTGLDVHVGSYGKKCK